MACLLSGKELHSFGEEESAANGGNITCVPDPHPETAADAVTHFSQLHFLTQGFGLDPFSIEYIHNEYVNMRPTLPGAPRERSTGLDRGKRSDFFAIFVPSV